ncbi:hypothetical protein HOLleu_37087 [Holothuria leucospilota]|uniref:CCHC-type domain-containing protein n=1 Tax=Holothuria leucospilota TaxID=206669 RepID=A0A9Q0YNM5_HOLLE|nr:hypothetical protein HOLleu_37087 [Holothuria leucospilota]
MASLKLEPYNPLEEQWESYQERLEQYFIVQEVTEEKKKTATLLAAVGVKTYALLKDLVAPQKPSELKYSEITDKLKSHFCPVPPTVAERFKFYGRKQCSDETVTEYLAELKKLAKTCNFRGFLDEALRDSFIFGLKDENTQKRLLGEDDSLSLEKAFKLAVGMETAKLNTDLVRRGSSVNMVSAEVKCYTCGKTGHMKRDCRFKDFKCRNCGKKVISPVNAEQKVVPRGNQKMGGKMQMDG